MADYKKRFGDRYDGRLIRSINPFYKIIPYIMRTRADAQNYFEDKIDISRTEAFLRRKRKESAENFNFLHIMIAAIVRTISQKPGLNRFIAGQKIYARNEILVSLAIKKQLTIDSPETTIKFKFNPNDTLSDVASKVNKAINDNKKIDTSNETDRAARLFMMCPGFFVKLLIWLLRTMDYYGIMPRILNELSPFHTSIFITDLGSLGIQPVYHHLYDFGTTSIFIAFGAKQTQRELDADSNLIKRKYVNLKIVTDERIVDGHYYASAFKLYRTLIQNPERLEHPPEQVVMDIV